MSAIFQFRTARCIYRDERLASKLYAWFFGISIPLLSWLWAFPNAIVGHSHDPLWIRLPLAGLLVSAIVGMFFVWVGMWWYWARLDASGKWAKRFWFVVLLFGFWFGAAAYYVCVYLPQVVRGDAARAVQTSSEFEESTSAKRSRRVLLWVLAGWYCAIVTFVAGMTLVPSVVARIPHFECIRGVVPVALIVTVAYALWVLYARGVRR
jgi:hypothetical protein